MTRKHLDGALDTLSGAVKSLRRGVGVSGLQGLVLHADTVVDIARTLSVERGDEDSADVLACAAALRAAIGSHLRDLDLLVPQASLAAEPVPVPRRCRRRDIGRSIEAGATPPPSVLRSAAA